MELLDPLKVGITGIQYQKIISGKINFLTNKSINVIMLHNPNKKVTGMTTRRCINCKGRGYIIKSYLTKTIPILRMQCENCSFTTDFFPGRSKPLTAWNNKESKPCGDWKNHRKILEITNINTLHNLLK
jgi:hypothetical protein